MIINKMFNRGSVEEIRNTINNLEVIGCVDKFTSYLEKYHNDKKNSSEIDEFEKGYMNKLDSDVDNLICDMLLIGYEAKSKEELLSNLRYSYLEGIYGIRDQIDNNGLRDIMDFRDADAYEYIKSYMSKTLEEYVNSLTLTEAQEKIKRLERDIKSDTDLIEARRQEIEKNINLLKELKGDKQYGNDTW